MSRVSKPEHELAILKNEIDKILKSGNYKELFKSIVKTYPNSNNKITIICNIKNQQFMLKIYTDDLIICSSDRVDGKPSPYVESEILRLLNELIEFTPCIPDLITTYKMTDSDYNANFKSIKECINSNDPLCVIWNSINSKYATGYPTFIATSAGNIDLYNFCKRACNHIDTYIIMSSIWMIMYTILIIRRKYPDFEHGDLFARNIILYYDYEYIKNVRPGSSYYLNFILDKKNYYVPYYGMIPRLIDFELSKLNSSLYAKQHMINETDDILQLLYSINNIYTTDNFVTVEIDKLLGSHIGYNLTYIQVAELIKLKPIEELLNLFEYDHEVPDDCIWGSWSS